VFLHGRVMIVGVGIDWQRHWGQFEHYTCTLQSSPFLPSSSLSLPVVDTSQKCQNLPTKIYTARPHEVTSLCFHQAIYSVYVYLCFVTIHEANTYMYVRHSRTLTAFMAWDSRKILAFMFYALMLHCAAYLLYMA
jgi:hypothetical protein